MKNKKEQALLMIAGGYTVEQVMDILDISPFELMEALEEEMGTHSKLVSVKVVEAKQHFYSEYVGSFSVNMN